MEQSTSFKTLPSNKLHIISISPVSMGPDAAGAELVAVLPFYQIQEIFQRAANLWPDAPSGVKAFADLVTVGQVQQDYYKQANETPPPEAVAQATPTVSLDMDAVSAEAKRLFTEEEGNPATSISRFELACEKFNQMYKLPQLVINGMPAPRSLMAERLATFKQLLAEELDEIDEIIAKLENPEFPESYADPVDALTDIADLLGDLQVFCGSEMVRFGLPITPVLEIIMSSNFSKLGADGLPIYRPEDGKVLKGQNYWKPEPAIKMLLEWVLYRKPPVEGGWK